MPAETLIFDLVLHKLVQHVAPHGEQTHHLEHAVRTLYRRLTDDLRAESAARYDKLLAELYDAQTAERARLARELHDRAGYWLSVAHRGMEELCSPAPGAPAPLPARAADAVEGAHSAVLEAMHSLRATTTSLRLTEPVTSLETALEAALAALSTEVTVRLQMTGDEAWAPPDVKDEIFLIVREAVRNAVVHGSPGLVVVGVQIAPHELRAHVDDDGRGFAHQVRHSTDGVGLATMQERAEALNGRCTVTSAVGRGTRVEICIPLQEQTDA
ncbi:MULTISPECIES: sensor histidine kinase [Streptomyces]|uniref:Oxygen sensor histidine kinase NreB n=1 Tax=Streptomyces bugieae TaxID=3098223 RepID=A0ABU7NSZ7_9ACTN|nr:ATP-binding protein [Streptomyces nigrescens]MEE4421612.1 ATP-binding protein [Streptomyces sp. DSM 41528]